MHEIRCANCSMRLWLYRGMGRAVPLPHDCPACHVGDPIDRPAAAAARLAARIDRNHCAQVTGPNGDDAAISRARTRLRSGASR
jgi:hypothetical protein